MASSEEELSSALKVKGDAKGGDPGRGEMTGVPRGIGEAQNGGALLKWN
jgi:hypothetical protein